MGMSSDPRVDVSASIGERFTAQLVARERSVGRLALTAGVCALVLLASVTAPVVLGGAGPATILPWVVAIATMGVLTNLLYRRGHTSPLFRVSWALEGFLQSVAIAAVLYATRNAASALLGVAMFSALRWTPTVAGKIPLGMLQTSVAYGGLTLWFAYDGLGADATVVAATMLTALTLLQSASKAAHQTITLTIATAESERELAEAELRNERARLARELHDGVGADVVALIMELRRHEGRTASPGAAALARRAEAVLEVLRAAIRWLRMEESGYLDASELSRAVSQGHRDTSADDSRAT